MKNKFALFAFLLLPFFAFADEQNKATTTSNPFGFLGDMFSPKTAKLNKLIEDKKLKEADECWRAFKTDHLCSLNFDQAFLHQN